MTEERKVKIKIKKDGVEMPQRDVDKEVVEKVKDLTGGTPKKDSYRGGENESSVELEGANKLPKGVKKIEIDIE